MEREPKALSKGFWFCIVGAVVVIAAILWGRPVEAAGPVVVVEWSGQAVRGCYDSTECRGRLHQFNVSVNGVQQNPGGYLDITIRPEAPRPGCALLNLPGYWWLTVSAWGGNAAVEFNNYDYESLRAYSEVHLCNQTASSFYGADSGEAWLAWMQPDGSAGAIVIGGAGLADANRDGRISVEDVFTFCGAWLSGRLDADADGTGTITASDLFEFVDAYFAG